MTETAWLDFINPVDVSSTWGNWGAVQGEVVGDADCLRTNDGDTSYVSVSNGYDLIEHDATEQPYYRDGGYSKIWQVDLEPDPTLPPVVASYDIRWYLTGALVTAGAGPAIERLTPRGFEIIGSFVSTDYTDDIPRGSINSGPSWGQIRSSGWQMPFRGTPRFLLATSPFGYARITRMRLQVTYVPLVIGLPPIRRTQRGDGYGIGGVPRAVQNTSRQASLRRGAAFS